MSNRCPTGPDRISNIQFGTPGIEAHNPKDDLRDPKLIQDPKCDLRNPKSIENLKSIRHYKPQIKKTKRKTEKEILGNQEILGFS